MFSNQPVEIDEKLLAKRQAKEIEKLIIEESHGSVTEDQAKDISEQVSKNLEEYGPIYHKDIRALVRFDILPKVMK